MLFYMLEYMLSVLWMCAPQVTTALTVSPSNAIMVPNVPISINTATISGLRANTNYSITINPGSGAGNCIALGQSDATGVLAAQTPVAGSSVQYAAVGTHQVTVTVFPSALCAPGKAAAVYGSVANAVTNVEVFTAATLTPSATTAVRGAPTVTFSAALSGLGASSTYTYTLNRDDGAGTASCTLLGTADASGALASRALGLPAAVYATAGLRTPALFVYHLEDCAVGTASANATLMAYASSAVTVSWVVSALS